MKIKKRYWAAAFAATSLLAVVGVKVPKPVQDFVNVGFEAAKGHSPR